MLFDTEDTIAAISTAAGTGARAIVRVSGPEAFNIAAAVFAPADGELADMAGFSSASGIMRTNAGAAPIELPGVAYVFRAPRSFTRDDVVELHIPGAAAAATALLASLTAAGARQARPGEFTARAFFSGRIDLSAAEAVADIINAADDAHLRSAVAALGGEVYRLCSGASEQLTEALANVEASIDMAEEDIQFATPAALAAQLHELSAKLCGIAQKAASMPDKAQLPCVAIAGRPNVGKSSLLNALSGTDRAIVSALAGTTRDVLTATMNFADGSAAVLQDVAGFIEPDSEIAAAADSAARQAVTAADVIVFVVDISEKSFEADAQLLAQVRSTNRRCPLELLANKTDQVKISQIQKKIDGLEKDMQLAAMGVSCESGAGLDEFKTTLEQRLGLHAERSGVALGLHERQKNCLISASQASKRAAELLQNCVQVADSAELVAIELRAALSQIGLISGQVVTEDILGSIFSRFCVGK